jgi:enamine deaminase RidA (YjgF/YER057c/UK114 family)
MFEENIREHGYEIPELPKAKLAYQPFVISGKTLYISGQLPLGFGELERHQGRLGENFSTEEGAEIAKICALNVLGVAYQACNNDLQKIKRCVKITVFVNSESDFTEQPAVANGASEVFNNVFQETGQHSRSAVGVAQLPFGVAVEVEAIFELK